MPSKSYKRILDEHLHILICQGNHEAYLKLASRYHEYAQNLAREILQQFTGSGVSFGELMAVCSHRFCHVVRKYDHQLCSFYNFWKDATEQAIMDYLLDNSYLANAKAFRGFIHYDEELDERRIVGEHLAEFNDDYHLKMLVKELKRLVNMNKDKFKKQEFTLLILVLDGYSLKELEHTDMMSRSALYLTFNNACQKLKEIVEGKAK